jgi:hypothetical protein
MRCICDRLRAAEQRQGALSYAHGLDHGYAAGIKAARDAVADLPNHYAMEPRHVALALAAIDALTK